MTTILRARFDGTALIPEEPVDLPVGETLTITVSGGPVEPPLPILADPSRSLEERLAAIRESFSHGIAGQGLPAEALRRESIYGDDRA